ncbi:MAG TPA: tRNA epoxyqueuosine(34) reductase QueG [Anaerolineales bacterium]|nr:tRNA epoxyqueuosine(34) reductase QueG [Anaerolineales bacterium]
MDPDELKEGLIEEAHRLGFTLAGIAAPDPPPSFPRYLRWVQSGRHAEMGYLATERNLSRRADPKRILPECRSILSLGMPYHPPKAHPGGVAAYAWGDDYHDVLIPLLKKLVAYLAEQDGSAVNGRWYTDTGPILERDIASRAGLGWIGKNSMLIHPQHGSYFLLAEILLDIELPPDEPFPVDHCGTCTRCLDACPTSCILPDRTLEAEACLSYLTIENKGEIPLEMRPKVGEWVFGCDVCQQVCPWNRFSHEHGYSAFGARPGIPPEDLAAELALSPQEFNRKFKDSPIKRAKRRGYQRNTAVVLGNQGDESAVPALAQALQDDEPLVRQHAAWALGQIGGAQAKDALHKALEAEQVETVFAEIELVLREM